MGRRFGGREAGGGGRGDFWKKGENGGLFWGGRGREGAHKQALNKALIRLIWAYLGSLPPPSLPASPHEGRFQKTAGDSLFVLVVGSPLNRLGFFDLHSLLEGGIPLFLVR